MLSYLVKKDSTWVQLPCRALNSSQAGLPWPELQHLLPSQQNHSSDLKEPGSLTIQSPSPTCGWDVWMALQGTFTSSLRWEPTIDRTLLTSKASYPQFITQETPAPSGYLRTSEAFLNQSETLFLQGSGPRLCSTRLMPVRLGKSIPRALEYSRFKATPDPQELFVFLNSIINGKGIPTPYGHRLYCWRFDLAGLCEERKCLPSLQGSGSQLPQASGLSPSLFS
jgi:hypothetical protein